MKNTNLHFLIIMVMVFSSCRSTKHIAMFQNLDKENTISYILKTPPIHLIKPYDNLYVNILTLDQNVNILFNPSLGGNSSNSNTQYMYGTPASQYINGYQVSQSGIITIPILGEINVADLTLEEAEKKISNKAEEYLKEPSVHVKLLNYKVDILGEVNNPNYYYNYEGRLNIFEAIAFANGITLYADLKNVVVNRKTGNKVLSYKVDLTNNDIYNSEAYYLQPNDIVYIPPTKLKKRNVNNSTFSIILTAVTTIVAVVALIK